MTARAPWTAFPTVTVRARGDWVATPDEVTVCIGLDVGKEEHFADVLDDGGETLFARTIANDEAAGARGLRAGVGDAPRRGLVPR
jgi:hypothetical protein